MLSRDQIRKRPLKVWKDLQYILSEQNVCHAGIQLYTWQWVHPIKYYKLEYCIIFLREIIFPSFHLTSCLLVCGWTNRRPYYENTFSSKNTGEPDYENLFAFNHSQRVRVGPEPSDLGHGGGKYGGSPGRLTQAVTSEHLAHVIFGHHDLQVST